jgi:hypothetical protein
VKRRSYGEESTSQTSSEDMKKDETARIPIRNRIPEPSNHGKDKGPEKTRSPSKINGKHPSRNTENSWAQVRLVQEGKVHEIEI